jgi:hypothetical protein
VLLLSISVLCICNCYCQSSVIGMVECAVSGMSGCEWNDTCICLNGIPLVCLCAHARLNKLLEQQMITTQTIFIFCFCAELGSVRHEMKTLDNKQSSRMSPNQKMKTTQMLTTHTISIFCYCAELGSAIYEMKTLHK